MTCTLPRLSWAENARRSSVALAAMHAALREQRRDRQLHMDLDALTEDPPECETCDGDNEVVHEACGGNGCRHCDGTGFVDCPECGDGSVDDGA